VWARLVDAFERGDEQRFGAIAAAPHGLRLRGERYGWRDIAALRCAAGMATIVTRDGRTAVAHAAEISFLDVLEHVVRDRPVTDSTAGSARSDC